MQIKDIGEFGLIDRIRDIIGETPDAVILGISDDAAVVETLLGLIEPE